jgi:hypothetical protein
MGHANGRLRFLAVVAVSAALPTRSAPAADAAASGLKAPAAFAGIADRSVRSQALFGEASKVLLHPRCLNCHPADDTPRQGDAAWRHDPPVVRGADNRGVPAMQCATCHQDKNLAQARVPGAPDWHLAPKEMAWMGRSAAAICAQLKDPKRNGGRTLEAIHTHTAEDHLVAWGWDPGSGRSTAPGTQAEFAALVRAWIDTGAVCPAPEGTR